MANKSGGLLIKLVVLLAVAGAVFFALDSWRKKSDVAGGTAEETAGVPALSREEAERIGTEIGTRIGNEIGTQIGREVAAQMLAERQSELDSLRKARANAAPPSVAAAAPAPAPEPAPAPAPAAPASSQSAPEVASAEPAPDQTASSTEIESSAPPAPRVPRQARAEGKIPGQYVAQSAAGRDAWWIKSASNEPDALMLTYAGSFKSAGGNETGIALMFSGKFSSQTDFASSISVSGGDVSGKWRLGASPGLIYMTGVGAGSYTVTVKAGLADSTGKTLKTEVSGPVEVQ